MQLTESPLELPEPKLTSSHQDDNNELSSLTDMVEPLKQEIITLKEQLKDAQGKLAQYMCTVQENVDDFVTITNECSKTGTGTLESPDSHIETDCEMKCYQTDDKVDIKYSNIVPIHKTNLKNGLGCNNNNNNNNINNQTHAPIAKMAERIKLKRATDSQRGDINPTDIINSDLPTAVAEHIVGDILRQCDTQSERHAIEVEFRRLNAKLEYTRSQNSVLALTLSETKCHCDRLALLCGKYESNAIALRLALGVCDRTIEAYDVLLALLETELALSDNQPGNFFFVIYLRDC